MVVTAGTAREDYTNDAGFKDGPANQAKFYSPFGITIHGREVAIADTGNRRLRIMPLPDLRGPLTVGSNEFQRDPKHYRILYIGLSHAFFGTGWSDSIPGRIESALLANQRQAGLEYPPKVLAVRIDGARLNALDDFIDNAAEDGQVDLVLLSIVPEAVMGVTLPPGVSNPVPTAQAMLRQLDAKLRASREKLFVYLRADSVISPVDGGGTDDAPPQNFNMQYLANQRAAIDLLKGADVPYYAALPDVMKYEQSNDRLPLWNFTERHPSSFGRAFIAQSIVSQLMALRPWSK